MSVASVLDLDLLPSRIFVKFPERLQTLTHRDLDRELGDLDLDEERDLDLDFDLELTGLRERERGRKRSEVEPDV